MVRFNGDSAGGINFIYRAYTNYEQQNADDAYDYDFRYLHSTIMSLFLLLFCRYYLSCLKEF